MIQLGLKKSLLSLNRELDNINRAVELNSEFGHLFGHSLPLKSDATSNIEVAILYLEDRRFYHHKGFEVRSIPRALIRLLRRGKINGISTIEQQVVRIATKRHERSITRKLREIFLGFILNLHLSKREIFDYYIHNAYLGYRMQGCEVASKNIFDLRACDLNKKQAAFIASLFPLPFPKEVYHSYRNAAIYPLLDPDDLIDFSENVAPRWAGRIKFRFKIAQRAYGFRFKSLLTR
ncbi:transglycosylase domain-containing protein [Marivivens donghaensis]|uniref:Transglycosylase domain-containing protein n=1 Tax=Marivivens donghaensis TaxID=1699413 RepID=A0ABX0W1K5_9RHOB|nr:biosynthetic peptidoglycan transglycosylase [Marivivens donghaensis]NIY73875.1 transglycosylase domain-containing protein [Marivivens donghaensis]